MPVGVSSTSLSDSRNAIASATPLRTTMCASVARFTMNSKALSVTFDRQAQEASRISGWLAAKKTTSTSAYGSMTWSGAPCKASSMIRSNVPLSGSASKSSSSSSSLPSAWLFSSPPPWRSLSINASAPTGPSAIRARAAATDTEVLKSNSNSTNSPACFAADSPSSPKLMAAARRTKGSGSFSFSASAAGSLQPHFTRASQACSRTFLSGSDNRGSSDSSKSVPSAITAKACVATHRSETSSDFKKPTRAGMVSFAMDPSLESAIAALHLTDLASCARFSARWSACSGVAVPSSARVSATGIQFQLSIPSKICAKSCVKGLASVPNLPKVSMHRRRAKASPSWIPAAKSSICSAT
mmetsp:Transcript_21844/g.50623  ORF Transcript_21844/g.50623 Transcript_21844/m.50623 type:complete len:356 (-) Transcript_21844:596-1663(-)